MTLTSMTSIRKFAYAALLAFTTFNLAPSLAFGQEPAHGTFTLPHDVHWQNAVVPAGDYRFSFEPSAAAGVFTLSKLNGTRTGFMFLVRDTDESKPTDLSRLVLDNTPAGSYVSAVQLPEFGMTLHFTVPPSKGNQVARAATAPMAGAQ